MDLNTATFEEMQSLTGLAMAEPRRFSKGEECKAKSRVWRIEHKTDGYGFKQNVGFVEPDRHTWR